LVFSREELFWANAVAASRKSAGSLMIFHL
jgi:hypothetical protein